MFIFHTLSSTMHRGGGKQRQVHRDSLSPAGLPRPRTEGPPRSLTAQWIRRSSLTHDTYDSTWPRMGALATPADLPDGRGLPDLPADRHDGGGSLADLPADHGLPEDILAIMVEAEAFEENEVMKRLGFSKRIEEKDRFFAYRKSLRHCRNLYLPLR